MKSVTFIIFQACVGLLATYFFVYAILSALGRYEVSVVDLGGRVNGYSWAPLGFYETIHPINNSKVGAPGSNKMTGGWNSSLVYTFYPLWGIDVLYVHKNKTDPP